MWAQELAIPVRTRTEAGAQPYHRQVFEQVRRAILEGTLASGDRLPSTRACARMLGLARNTVARAYEDLLAAGYLAGRVGSGTYVSAGLAPGPVSAQAPAVVKPTAAAIPSSLTTGYLPFDFRPGIPDWEAFPRALWLRLVGRAMKLRAAELSRYGEPGGHLPLRAAISRYLAVSRGVSAGPEQVVIVSGSQQGLDLIARVTLSPADAVALEDPGYPEARHVLAAAARPYFVPVDGEGIDVGALERLCRRGAGPRLVSVTPSHQFPTGVTLSLSRRFALLELAARRNALIVEDDYDSEFRLPGRTLESLQGLDRAQRTVYLGTFSTVLFPPLRVGYVVLPPGLVEPVLRAKWLADRQTATLEQLALTDFLEEGHFERHLRRMRRLVDSRRAALRSAVETHASEWLALPEPRAGMHQVAGLTLSLRGLDAQAVERRVSAAALSRGIGVAPVAPCWSRPPRHPALLLGYAALPEEKIRRGIKLLAAEIALLARSPAVKATRSGRC